MTQPQGFIHLQYPMHVCKLRKAIYRLKQSPRAWYLRLSYKLADLGFQPSFADTSLFVRIYGTNIIYVLVYFDDPSCHRFKYDAN